MRLFFIKAAIELVWVGRRWIKFLWRFCSRLQFYQRNTTNFSNKNLIDLIPLQSKFFPPNFSFVFLKRDFWREKIYSSK
jgi:hypothetical protein